MVSAPAGFGKTTLVAAWAQQQPLPVGWLSLDAGDNDPNRFLAYLVAALQSADPNLGRELRAALAGGQAPPIEAAAIMLINDLAQLQQDVLLVLDDFHVIEEPRIEQALATLVAHQPPQLHLLIATREDPPLPLARLRAQGRLVELRAQELRFSPDEAATFLTEGMGLALSPQQAADLDARIEGWIAGLQLAGLSLQKSSRRRRLHRRAHEQPPFHPHLPDGGGAAPAAPGRAGLPAADLDPPAAERPPLRRRMRSGPAARSCWRRSMPPMSSSSPWTQSTPGFAITTSFATCCRASSSARRAS